MKFDEMNAQGKKKFQVVVQTAKVDYFSVWATSEDAAGQEVVKRGQGRPLGSEGPVIVNVAAREIDPRDTDEEIMTPKEKSLIEVVKG